MYEVVVGIDFGSSGSGFAYSFFNKNKIIHGQIYGASVDYKVPTEIILDDKNYIIEFGANCPQYLKEKGLETNHYFKGIKMHLYENKRNIIAQNSGKKLPLKLVIQKVLEKIKELAINEILRLRPKLETNKIKWVVTVPAIWNEHQKSVMMESCKGAGLINNIR
jgi:molecular chaperone DnaK (HSP70)